MSRMLRSQVPTDPNNNYWYLLNEQTGPLKQEVRRQQAKTCAARKNQEETEQKNRSYEAEMSKLVRERNELRKQLVAARKPKETPKTGEGQNCLKRKVMEYEVDMESLRQQLTASQAALAKEEQAGKKLRLSLELKEVTVEESKQAEMFWRTEFKKVDSEKRDLGEVAETLQQEIDRLEFDMESMKTDLQAVIAASSTSIDCAICLDKKHELHEGLSALICGHCYCTPCVTAWWTANHLAQQPTQCPKCRRTSKTPPKRVYIFDD